MSLPRPVHRALAWKHLSQLVWRHPDRGVRLVELHPGGGQYHCLGLVTDDFGRVPVQINLVGSSLRVDRDPGEPVMLDYPELVGAGVDVVERVEQLLRWGDATPRHRAPSVSLAVLGELLARTALGALDPRPRCGWHDSAGMEGSSVLPWALGLPGVVVDGPWQEEARSSSRYWGLGVGSGWHALPVLVVDVATGQVLDRSGGTRWSLWKGFGQGQGIRALAWRLEQDWRSPLPPGGG